MTVNLKHQSEAPSPKVSNKRGKPQYILLKEEVRQLKVELEAQRDAIKYLLYHSKNFQNEILKTQKKTT